MTQEVLVKQVSDMKRDEDRFHRILATKVDSKADELHHQLHEFRKDTLAEVDALRHGVTSIGQASGVLPPVVPLKRVSWA